MLRVLIARFVAMAAAVSLFVLAGLAPARAGTPGWRIVATLGPADGSTGPAQLVASSATDAWSTWGSCGPCGGTNPVFHDYVLHWDGSAWAQIPPAGAFPASSTPAAFAARSATDAWAFGYNKSSQPVSARWNGSTWTVRPLPSWVLRNSRSGDVNVTAAVFSPSNVWVFSEGAASQPTVAARFNGTAWRQVTLPGVPFDVSVLSANDMWALGATPGSVGTSSLKYLAMHWNGTSWRTLTVPRETPPPGGSYVVTDPVAISAQSVWMAAGIQSGANPTKDHLLHWNGTHWGTVALLFPTSVLNEMAQDGHGGLWLVTNGPAPGFVWYFDHYNGGRWSRTPVPTAAGASHTQVTQITSIPGTQSMWAAGSLIENSGLVGATLKDGP